MNANDLIKEWFVHSYNNLLSAQHLFNEMHPKQIDIACYLSQQCAETALKGYLQFSSIEPDKIHNLRSLCEQCAEKDNSFQTIITSCTSLTVYSNATRYPNELATDEAAGKAAIDNARLVYKFCLSKVPEACRPNESPEASEKMDIEK
jgi:HEPN domain-containing protein